MKLISVFAVCTSLLIIANCSNQAETPKVPESAPLGWQLKSIQPVPLTSAPETIRSLGAKYAWRAEYGGPGVAHVHIFAGSTTLEMAQKWRPVADTVILFNPRYFVVVNWADSPRPAVTALNTALEKALKVD